MHTLSRQLYSASYSDSVIVSDGRWTWAVLIMFGVRVGLENWASNNLWREYLWMTALYAFRAVLNRNCNPRALLAISDPLFTGFNKRHHQTQHNIHFLWFLIWFGCDSLIVHNNNEVKASIEQTQTEVSVEIVRQLETKYLEEQTKKMEDKLGELRKQI